MLTTFKCRYCCRPLSKLVVSLKKMPLTDDFILADKLQRFEYLEDINIFECQKCGLVQNPADFNHEGYYQDYKYSSGHSAFTKKFMQTYAQTIINYFKKFNNQEPESVIEVGSGDGVQLQQFLSLGVSKVLGVEPSDYLARIAVDSGVPTYVDLFGPRTGNEVKERFDICVSSYTLDHVRSPLEYLRTSHLMLNDGGIIAFEVHNLEKIIERSEYCLLEHEHTIYLTPADAIRFLEQVGFRVLAVDPINPDEVRGNSLVLIAQKINGFIEANTNFESLHNPQLDNLNNGIVCMINQINQWIDSIPASESIVGFGAGGRGVMTLAALDKPLRFSAVFDSNFQSDMFFTPKTRIPVVGPDRWSKFADSHCLVFSYGYYHEIKKQLIEQGFIAKKIISLADFFVQKV